MKSRDGTNQVADLAGPQLVKYPGPLWVIPMRGVLVQKKCGDPSSDMQTPTQQGGGGVLKGFKTPTSHAVTRGDDMHQCTLGLG